MATREELKAILDEWIPKYIRQVVELRSGSRLSAERYNELMNLLITQGDDTIELAETVKQYMELLVADEEAAREEFTQSITQSLNETTTTVTNIAENAVVTAESAVSSVNQYKAVMDADMEQFKNTVNSTVSQMSNDIVQFKESVTQSIAASDARVNSAVETANQLTADMEAYRTELTQLTEETFTDMQTALSQQVSDNVVAGIASLKDELIGDINTTISELEEQVMTIANTAEQAVNSAVQDIEAYKQDMDVRLDAALEEVEDSLSVAGEIIQDAGAIYARIDEMNTLVNSFEDRLSEVESPTYTAASANAELTSGEHISTAFSKIAKAVKSLIAHLADTAVHFTSAERTKLSNVADNANNYTHPNSGVTAGTYRNVTVNAQGHVTEGSNPTVTVAQGGTGQTSIRSTLNSYFPTQLSAIVSIPILGTNWENNGFVPLATLKSALGSMPASDVYSWAKQSVKPSYSWNEITSKPTSFTPASHDHNNLYQPVDTRTVATKPSDYSNSLEFMGLKNSATVGNPSADTYAYILGLKGWTDPSGGQAHELAFTDSGIFIRQATSDTTWGGWRKLITSSDIGSQSVNYAASASIAGTASYLGRGGNTGTPMVFNWSGLDGQPPWLWGGTDGTNMYVYNPSNFSVNYAATAGTANSVAWGNVTSKPTSFTPTSHNQAASTITAGTFAGQVKASTTAVSSLGDFQLRDIKASTTDITAGTTALTSGYIYVVYE